jgi:hypothetical protein
MNEPCTLFSWRKRQNKMCQPKLQKNASKDIKAASLCRYINYKSLGVRGQKVHIIMWNADLIKWSRPLICTK